MGKRETLHNRVMRNEIINCFEIFLYLLAIICFLHYFSRGNISKTLQPILIASVLTGLRLILKITDIELNPFLRASLLIFIFMAMFMAVEFDFYTKIPIFDKILHSLSGIIFFFVGLTIFQHINKNSEKIQINTPTVVLFCLFFSFSVASCWEIFEFTVDRIFGFNCQRGSLFDTMGDIICGTSSASVTGLYVYARFRKLDCSAIMDYFLKINNNNVIGNVVIKKESI